MTVLSINALQNSLPEINGECLYFEEDENSDSFLGHGSFGHVYKALYTPTSTSESLQVAVKIIEVSLPRKCDRRQFWREVASCAAVPEACVAVLGASYSTDKCLLVMEFMPHGDLRKFRLSEQLTALPYPERWGILKSMANCVAALHAENIYHRDIKPANFLMNHDAQGHWSVKICDLGVSQANWTSLSTSHERQTTQNYKPGTFAYKAPEWLSGMTNTYEASMDIYSLAISFWECTFLEDPWGQRTKEEIRLLVSDGNRPHFTPEDRQTIPEAYRSHLSRAIEKGWARDPQERPNAKKMATWMQNIASELEIAHLVNEIVSAVNTTFETANGCLRRLVNLNPPLTSDQVHRVFAIHFHQNTSNQTEEDAAFAERWNLPDYTGNNQFKNVCRSNCFTLFADLYRNEITDQDLQDKVDGWSTMI
jgi:receptor-interacting serine/threonine-protein kinase 2